MKSLGENRKILIGCFALVFLLGMLLPEPARAIFGIESFFTFIVEKIAFLLQGLAGLVLTLAAALVKVSISLNYGLLTGIEKGAGGGGSFVVVGWQILRDFANLGFVLVIIFMAFATIIRWKTYGYQKLLLKLIAAAIIVNFSLIIATSIIDFTNVITKFFFDRAGGEHLAESLTAAFGPQKLIMDPDGPGVGDDLAGAAAASLGGFLSTVATLVFVIVFTMIAAIVMLGLACMMLIRYLYLAILIIVSPIIWLLWVVPKLDKHFHEWWDKFIKWNFFAPIAAFFIYLTFVSLDTLKDAAPETVTSGFFTGAIASIMNQGIMMFLTAATMVGGLMAAEKFGIAGSKAFLGAAKGVGKGAQKWAGNKGARVGALGATLAAKAASFRGGPAALTALGTRMTNWAAPPGATVSRFNQIRRLAGGVGGVAKGVGDGITSVARGDNIPPSVSLLSATTGGVRAGAGVFKQKHAEKKWRCTRCHDIVSSSQEPMTGCSKASTVLRDGHAHGSVYGTDYTWELVPASEKTS